MKARRRQSKDKLMKAEKRGNDDALKQAQNAALARACEKGDETKKKHAMDCARATYAIERVARDAEAKGVDVGGKKLDALADVLSACRTGECPAEVQDETEAEYENGRAYEAKILLQGTLRAAKQLGKFRRVSGDELLRLRVEDDARRARRAEQGPVRVGDTDEHMALLGKKQANDLAYKRKLRDRARQGIDRSALPSDVVADVRGDIIVYVVDWHLQAPSGEERTLWPTPEEAHAQATRWRKILGRPWHAERAAKAARGGVPNVLVNPCIDDLFSVQYKTKHTRKSRYVRKPGTGGSWYYDWDAALQLKEDYEKSNKGASWFVSAAEVKAAEKEGKKRSGRKRAGSRKKPKP